MCIQHPGWLPQLLFVSGALRWRKRNGETAVALHLTLWLYRETKQKRGEGGVDGRKGGKHFTLLCSAFCQNLLHLQLLWCFACTWFLQTSAFAWTISCPDLKPPAHGLHSGSSGFLFFSSSFHFTNKLFPVLRLLCDWNPAIYPQQDAAGKVFEQPSFH